MNSTGREVDEGKGAKVNREVLDASGFVRPESGLRCGQCRYSLAGLSVRGACPECGTSVQRTLGFASELDAAGNVSLTSTRLCIRCGYALKGLPGGSACPECGTAVSLSLRERRLHNASPEYIVRIRSGLSLVLNGILLTICFVFVAAAISTGLTGLIGLNFGMSVDALMALVAIGAWGISVMIAVGYLRYATPDPSEVESGSTRSARKILRGAVIVQLGLSTVQMLMNLLPVLPVPAGLMAAVPALEGLGQLAGFAALLVQFICVMRYTRWLGSRVPDKWIVNRSRLYMWLLPVISIVGCIALLIGPLIALILYWNLLDRLRKHLKAIEAGGTHMGYQEAGIG